MKKIILLASLVFLVAGASMAGQAELFSYNQETIDMEMASLTNLENFVLENPGLSLNDLIATENVLVADMTSSTAFYGLEAMSDRALGIGGFWWGCCLGPVGVLVVFLMAEDSGETRSSIVGCVISSLLGAGGGILSRGNAWY